MSKPRGPIISESHPRASIFNCFRCKKTIPLQWEWEVNSDRYQTDNDVTLEFHGGYGQFTDCLDDCPAESIRLCHECAHDLCDWLGADPRRWHTHSEASGQHSDHHKESND